MEELLLFRRSDDRTDIHRLCLSFGIELNDSFLSNGIQSIFNSLFSVSFSSVFEIGFFSSFIQKTEQAFSLIGLSGILFGCFLYLYLGVLRGQLQVLGLLLSEKVALGVFE